eukprot:TRINITY_DN2514_c0_g1_i1.p1 TRINITY_DN2514_c0_g1~~TRINITY_DN2514_c0_g1_i1.p1  ORF type:complete len:246 (-),score=54.21 TRINITY_DN2514_c0_g1_i1:342-1079(-)
MWFTNNESERKKLERKVLQSFAAKVIERLRDEDGEKTTLPKDFDKYERHIEKSSASEQKGARDKLSDQIKVTLTLIFKDDEMDPAKEELESHIGALVAFITSPKAFPPQRVQKKSLFFSRTSYISRGELFLEETKKFARKAIILKVRISDILRMECGTEQLADSISKFVIPADEGNSLCEKATEEILQSNEFKEICQKGLDMALDLSRKLIHSTYNWLKKNGGVIFKCVAKVILGTFKAVLKITN